MTRRRRSAGLISATVALSLFGTSIASAAVLPNEWSGPGKTPTRTAYNSRSGVVPTNVGDLTESWSAPGGTFTAPAAAADSIFVGDNGGLGRARLRAYDAADGTLLWSRYFGSDTTTTVGNPATDGNLVFVTVERATILGWIYDLRAFDAVDGAPVWSAEIGVSAKRLKPRDVLVTAGRVITPTAEGIGFRHLAVYTAGSGDWRYSVSPGRNITAFAANSAVAYVATAAKVTVYDLDTGLDVGTYLSVAGATSIIIGSSSTFYATPGRIWALDSTGFTLWTRPLAAGCVARLRILTPTMLAASHKCGGASRPLFMDRLGGGPVMNPTNGAPGDTPIAAGSNLMIAVGPGGVGLKIWDTRPGRQGLALAAPATADLVSLTTTGGPVLGIGMLVVPELGRIQVFDLA